MDVRRFTISANGKASCVCNVLTESEAMAVLQSVARLLRRPDCGEVMWAHSYVAFPHKNVKKRLVFPMKIVV